MTTIRRAATTVSGLPRPGDTWSDRYKITAELGRGGFGRVYRAWDPLLERDVAIKMLRASDDFTPTDHQRFRRETNIAASLDHRNIVTIYDGGERDGLLYLVMRFVAGHDLRYELANGPLEQPRAVSVIGQVGAALDYAHDKGLVHRDVKPGNILCDADTDAVYLADFGISRQVDQTTDNPVTQGLAPATLAYAAPEQMRTSARVDGRTDLYALGCVLFECLTGRKPFEGEIAEMITAHLHEAPPRVSAIRPELPRSWDRVVATAMAKDPADRYRRCAELVAAAEFVLPPDDAPIATAPATISTARAARPVDEPAAIVSRPGAGATRPLDHGAAPTERALRTPVGTQPSRPPSGDDADERYVGPPASARAREAGPVDRRDSDDADHDAARSPTVAPASTAGADLVARHGRAALAVLGLLVAGIVVWSAWPVLRSGPADDTGGGGVAADADGAGALDDAQRDLLSAVGVFDEADCRPSTRDPLGDEQVTIACTSEAQTPTRVVFRRYSSVEQRDAAFDGLARPASDGDCRVDRRATHAYEGERGPGRVLCLVDRRTAGLSWTVPSEPIMGSARLDDPAAAGDLYTWWATLVARRDA